MGPVVTDSINHSQSAATTGMSAESLYAHFVSTGVKVRVCLFLTPITKYLLGNLRCIIM